uniref:Uncharacterized protein n=1 Tax=Globodera rostochiensis TaxID=31243 RepID=A0A914IA53_GLORO
MSSRRNLSGVMSLRRILSGVMSLRRILSGVMSLRRKGLCRYDIMSTFLNRIVKQTTAQIPSVGQKDKMQVAAVDGEQQREAGGNIQQEIPSVGQKDKMHVVAVDGEQQSEAGGNIQQEVKRDF